MATVGDAPYDPNEAPRGYVQEQPYQAQLQQQGDQSRRGLSGTLLFLVTLGVALVLIVVCFVSLSAIGTDNPDAAFVVPALALVVWFLFVIALLFFAGRAITDRNRPGEAGTAVVLALFLTPVVFSALPIAIGAQGAMGLASLYGGDTFMDLEDGGFEEYEEFEGESNVDGYGDDPELDALYDECEGGNGTACSELWASSPVGSEYEAFAEQNGGAP